MTKLLNKLVVVEWLDAWADSTWKFRDEIQCKPTKVYNVGWLIQHNKEGVYLVSRVQPHGAFGACAFIPQCNIVTMKPVKGARALGSY